MIGGLQLWQAPSPPPTCRRGAEVYVSAYLGDDSVDYPSVHADHWPLSRRDLVPRSHNPHDPANGRELCGPCRSSETAVHQPGGGNR